MVRILEHVRERTSPPRRSAVLSDPRTGKPFSRRPAAGSRWRGRPSPIPAGFTYLGQFVDHDLTFDRANVMLGENVPPSELLQARWPRLDLDSLYDAGPGDPESAKFYGRTVST